MLVYKVYPKLWNFLIGNGVGRRDLVVLKKTMFYRFQ